MSPASPTPSVSNASDVAYLQAPRAQTASFEEGNADPDQGGTEALRTVQSQVLELAIQPTSLGEALDALVCTVEAQSPSGMLGSILLMDKEGAHLCHGAGPSLPPAYNAAVDGIAVSPGVGSCGTAAHAKQPVYVSDIAIDPLWVDFRNLALSHGLRACWSTPILSGQGRVLGTFAMYYREPREPSPADLALVDFVARSASLIIEHKRAETARRESEAQFKFLDALNEATTRAFAPHEIMAATTELLGRHLRVTRCAYADVDRDNDGFTIRDDWTDGAPSSVGEYSLDLFGSRAASDMRTGRTLIIRDVDRELPADDGGGMFSAIGIKALICCPLVKRDRLVAMMAVHQSAPRDWTRAETALVETAVERAWAHIERIRAEEALRESEARSRTELERLVEERTAALLREIDVRRRAEEALRQGEKLQALGQLTGGIAHDFNNIVQVVASGATLLRRPELSEERRVLILDGIAKAAGNAKELTGRLLAFARKQALQPKTFDLNARLVDMAELLRSTLGSRISVETDFASDLWPVHADPSQLEVAVLNLAVNARDAMLPEGGTVTLETRNTRLEATSEREPGEYVCLAVKDTGQGMPPAVLARVFEPFFTTKGPDRGTGLGLAQVHGFSKQSGGDIAIESVSGKGTTVTLHLPRASEAQLAEPSLPTATSEGEAMQRTTGRTVLVVDDNLDIAGFAAGLLEGLGYATLRADSAGDVLALLAEHPVDAVFSDVVMPGPMNGVQLASTLRLHHPRVAVVLATGYSEVLADWKGRTVAEVLGKPYRLEELAAALDRAFAAVEPNAPGQATGEGA